LHTNIQSTIAGWTPISLRFGFWLNAEGLRALDVAVGIGFVVGIGFGIWFWC